jgi:hypothetical protein
MPYYNFFKFRAPLFAYNFAQQSSSEEQEAHLFPLF